MLNITVNAVFLDDQSIPEDDIYLWAYHIQIINKYEYPVIIKKRFFEVIDSLGQRNVIEGNGVANKELTIASNEKFEYVSGVLLNQPSGFFRGFFIVEKPSGVLSKNFIPNFSLDSKYDLKLAQ